MPPTGHVRLILELDIDADPIAGSVVDGLGGGRAFSGWMALTRTIELALDGARHATSAMTSTDTSTATRKKT